MANQGVTTGLFVGGLFGGPMIDMPNMIISSLDEFEATTPSPEFKMYKDRNAFLNPFREDFLYDSIIEGKIQTITSYTHY